ncbi:PH domain-containing protein [Candidatus Viridilinea mediisalina]|uniref:YdbS-like PH domain-containing protein n=1 Tax=Candidatus Viridilinea mediisalina TaxID=2024553 RepID=A0A2A6RFK8_9CHLR|nr:PH domain-containing protein [Candidatus Viridilinea mediisalina]PDW01721.1 hypothetical protein CJ255_17695 [Candidatus Viridilinea mediisalina]
MPDEPTSDASDEHVLYQGRLHWTIAVRPVMITSLALVLLSSGDLLLGVGVMLVAAVFWGATLLAASNSAQLITEQRVRLSSGRIFRERVEIALTQVERVKVERDVMGRWLGYGTLVVEGRSGERASCPNLTQPDEFQRELEVAAGLGGE